jgi:hypothetical protein
MQKSAVIQIGNSDDKLTQMRWSEFVHDIQEALPGLTEGIHFGGGSPANAPWQNYCWCVVVEENLLFALRDMLHVMCRRYQQESIALIVGDTEFLDRSRPTE